MQSNANIKQLKCGIRIYTYTINKLQNNLNHPKINKPKCELNAVVSTCVYSLNCIKTIFSLDLFLCFLFYICWHYYHLYSALATAAAFVFSFVIVISFSVFFFFLLLFIHCMMLKLHFFLFKHNYNYRRIVRM